MTNKTKSAPDPTALPDYLEKMQAQLPALELLSKMGWKYLPPGQTIGLRHGRLGTTILDAYLIEHIRSHCRYASKGQEYPFTENAIQNAVQALKSFRATGAMHEHEQAYDLLCLGTSVPQTVEGDTKSFTINYIDWKNPANNTYHCTAEYKIERIGQQKHYIPDIVLFVNGIPLVVIECKRSSYTDEKKKPIELAIGQLGDYQAREGIPQLFLYAQLLLALARDKAEYGTTGSERKFWSQWREEGLDKDIAAMLARPLPPEELERLYAEPFGFCRKDYTGILKNGREIYEQDRLVYGLCRPGRLLELIYKFIVFDNGIKKIARYQQYFTVGNIIKRVMTAQQDAKRPGGVVWHTQGSGKSLTMVLLAKSLALHPAIVNPKVILVTDRIDLDDQIMGTFHACGMEPVQAATGKHLVELLRDNRAQVVTTIINKFVTAAASRELQAGQHDGTGRNTFVLVDEGHRSQYSEQHAQMKLALGGACFIAFTGTPLAKKAKRNTFAQFGELFRPAYTITQAIRDKAIVPLLYEARHVPQTVDRAAIDSWFEKVTVGLSKEQCEDLKCKFATDRQLNKVKQKVRMIAWDVSQHYCSTYQGTGLKGQLVAPDKATALLYKQYLDEFGRVTSQILMSPPTQREGDDDSAGPSAEEQQFWSAMMDRYGTEKKYNQQLIAAFKRGDEPEIIVVVDKLLTGFDAPCNTVLYLARKLKEHTLLQAIARVNRLHEGKEYGLILDYSGVISELDEVIDFYSKLASYDTTDLEDTVTYLSTKAAQMPQLHSDLWELFTAVRGAKDPEVYEVHLRDAALRTKFYDRFSRFARTLALALSSTNFLEITPLETIFTYKRELKFFQNLRAAVSQRYQERVDYSEFEPRIRKLLDMHVGAQDVQQLSDPIALFDDQERRKIMADQGKSAGAKADMIAAAVRHTIDLEMPKDPAFYKRFSAMLEETLRDYHAGRIKAIEALQKVNDIAAKVETHTDDSIPQSLSGNDMARRYYGCLKEELATYLGDNAAPGVTMALRIAEGIQQHKIRDWQTNTDVLNRMRGAIDDVLYAETAKCDTSIPVETHDAIIDRCIEVASANEQ